MYICTIGTSLCIDSHSRNRQTPVSRRVQKRRTVYDSFQRALNTFCFFQAQEQEIIWPEIPQEPVPQMPVPQEPVPQEPVPQVLVNITTVSSYTTIIVKYLASRTAIVIG